MTKRKAIEAAMKRLRVEAEACGGAPFPESVERELDRSHEYGRIAGLREAAKMLPPYGMIRARDTRRKLRAHANALAKKARAKK